MIQLQNLNLNMRTCSVCFPLKIMCAAFTVSLQANKIFSLSLIILFNHFNIIDSKPQILQMSLFKRFNHATKDLTLLNIEVQINMWANFLSSSVFYLMLLVPFLIRCIMVKSETLKIISIYSTRKALNTIYIILLFQYFQQLWALVKITRQTIFFVLVLVL